MDDRTISTSAGDDLVSRTPDAAIGGGRLGIYAALGALTGAVPLPWVPDALATRVRGALVHDVAARHGFSLTPEAREMLAGPTGGEGPRGMVVQAARFFGLKLLARVGPIGFLSPLRSAVTTWALGHLFNRYIESARTERAVRIDVDEARRVRQIIDRAVMHALTADARLEKPARPPEELRDTLTQLIDGVIGATAAVPGWLVRRLDAAFDELMPHAPR